MATPTTKFWQEVQSYLVVAVVTVLIWLYAEANTLSEESLSATIKFVGAPDLYIEQPDNFRATLTYLSPTGQRSAVQTLAQKTFELRIHDDPHSDDPQQNVLLKERLAGYDPLKKLGVTIKAVQPPSMAIKVHRLVTKTLAIRVVGADVQFSSEPSTNPSEAIVKLPAKTLRKFEHLTLETRLPRGLGVGVSADTRECEIELTPELRNTLPGNYRPEVNPPTTTVTFTVKDLNESETLFIPVWILLPPDAVGKYSTKIDGMTIPIKLKGPSDVIERIKADPTKVEVYVRLDADQLHDGAQQGELAAEHSVVRVPPDVEVIGPRESIRIEIAKISQPARTPKADLGDNIKTPRDGVAPENRGPSPSPADANRLN